jgi:hypothetical protein
MNTILFVEREPNGIGFHLTKQTFRRVPQGKIRIARFNYAFMPDVPRVQCYYSEIHFKQMIWKWKKRKHQELVKRNSYLLYTYTDLPITVIRHIALFM